MALVGAGTRHEWARSSGYRARRRDPDRPAARAVRALNLSCLSVLSRARWLLQLPGSCHFRLWYPSQSREFPRARRFDMAATSYKVEVIADSSGQWCSNALRFATEEEAKVYGDDLFMRWTAV